MMRCLLVVLLLAFTAQAKPRRLSKVEVEKLIATVPSRPNMARPGVTEAMIDAWYKKLSAKQQQAVDQYCSNEDNAYTNVCGATPLVANFDDAPVRFGALGAFPFTPGFPTTTAWPSVATPWLARDLDGSGCIESGAELFGSNTQLADGTAAKDGFVALRELDANHDGILDAADPAFASLVLWANSGDRVCRASELTPLSTRITSISLHVMPGTRPDEMLRATMTWRDAEGAHVGSVVDVFLRERVRPTASVR